MKFKPTTRTLKILEQLTPYARKVITEMLSVAYELNMNMQVHSGYRSPQEQDRLYAQGRTSPGKIVTNAKGTPTPQSTHCYKVAVDTHFDCNQDGVAEWDMVKYEKVWNECKKRGLDKKGLFSGLEWKTFREGPHFEVSFGKSWRDFAAGFDPEKHYQSLQPKQEPVKPVEPPKPDPAPKQEPIPEPKPIATPKQEAPASKPEPKKSPAQQQAEALKGKLNKKLKKLLK